MADGKTCWDCLYRETRQDEEPCSNCYQDAIWKGNHPHFAPIDGLNEKRDSSDSKKVIRSEILTEANSIISGKRKGEEYGPPEDSFSAIAGLWSEYLDRKVKPHDVAVMMALVKIARIKGGAFKLDNWIDLAGYAACGGECHWRELGGYAGYETERG